MKYKSIYFTRYLGEYIFYSILTVYLSDIGFNGTQVGTILSFSPLILALSLPFWLLIDKGRARKILIITVAVLIIALEYVITFTADFAILVFLMLMYAAMRAPIAPSLDSMVTVYCVENGKEFSSIRIWGSAGYILAVMTGSYLYKKIDFIWIVVMSSVFFAFFITASIFTKPLELDRQKRRKDDHDYRLLFRNKAYLAFLLAQIICCALLYTNNGFDILYLKYRGLSTSLFGIITLVRVGSEIAALTVLRKKKFTYKIIYLAVPIFMLTQSVVYFFNLPLPFIFIMPLFSGAASGFLIYLSNKYISMVVRPRNVTIATYFMVISHNLSLALCLFLGGIVMDYIGINYIYMATGIGYIITFVIIMLFINRNPVPVKSEASA